LPTSSSPLRYPGGKTKLYTKVVELLRLNGLEGITYAEPFCGGCGLAIKLLLNDDVSSIIINDANPCIYTFWKSVLDYSEQLCELISDCSITIEERENQKSIIENIPRHTTLAVGFATLYLNRTNVSGILTAGPIGGKDQLGTDKLDARFKKQVLIEKISNISAHKDRISLFNLDAIDLIDRELSNYELGQLFINFDPPYVTKGQELYLNHYSLEDHEILRDKIIQCNQPWIVTYDYHDLILNLYRNFHHERINVNHSAGKMKLGEELIIYANNIRQNMELVHH